MFERIEVRVGSFVSGVELVVPVFKFKGRDPQSPKTYVQANIHGAELQGIAVAYRLIEYLSKHPPLGDVTIVPSANPHGSNMKVGEYTQGRFSTVTGENFNRAYFDLVGDGSPSETSKGSERFVDLADFVDRFRGEDSSRIGSAFRDALRGALDAIRTQMIEWGAAPERRLALEIQSMSIDADIVLDLHTGSRAPLYIYAPRFTFESVRWFRIPHVLLIPVDFSGSLDEASFRPWWRLHAALKEAGREDMPVGVEAFTIELESQERFDLDRADDQLHHILGYLRHRGALGGEPLPPEDEPAYCSLENYRTIYSPVSGWADYQVQPGSRVRAGDVTVRIFQLPKLRTAADLQSCLHEVKAPKDGIVLTIFASSAVHEGAELFKLMTEVS